MHGIYYMFLGQKILKIGTKLFYCYSAHFSVKEVYFNQIYELIVEANYSWFG